MNKMRYYIMAGMLLALSACGARTVTETVEVPVPVPQVEVVTVEAERPRPTVPNIDQLSLRDVDWVVITPENVEEKFAQIKNGEPVFFAVTADGYESLSLNLSDLRSQIEQYQRVIGIYERSYD